MILLLLLLLLSPLFFAAYYIEYALRKKLLPLKRAKQIPSCL